MTKKFTLYGETTCPQQDGFKQKHCDNAWTLSHLPVTHRVWRVKKTTSS